MWYLFYGCGQSGGEMSKRKGLSKKTRFEVFKRDSFTCQYCGKRAPEIVLACDHINPVAAGGENDILNLITACVECNAGKSDRLLSDQAVVSKQVDQLADLQERREQIEMLVEWRQGLESIQTDATELAAMQWSEATEGQWVLSKTGKDKLRKWIKEYGLDLILQAMPESMDSYGRRDDKQAYTDDSISVAFGKLGAVARVIRDSAEKPYLKRIFYIRGILRARLSYVDDREAFRLMDESGQRNVDFDSLERIAKTTRNWTAFRSALEEFISSHPLREQ
jgi:hypothetical protein